jgi:hypothetical protein
MPVLPSAKRSISAAAILGVVLGLTCLASADSKKPAAPPPKPTAPAAKPAGNPGGGTTYRPNTGGSPANHPGPSGPSANRPGVSGPSANHPAGPSANHPAGPSGIRPSGLNEHGGMTPDRGPRPVAGRTMPAGVHERVAPNGATVRMRPNGRPSDVHDPGRGMDVHHGLNGNRAISVERADHSRVFAERGRPGFVERPYSFHGHDFARRTYFYHGREYSHFYHGYGYRGVYLNVYAPGFYYRPAFYGWAYNPWATPIAFGWGWGGNPWFGYYGYYFQPYPVYPSAAFWLTDYIISSDLQTAYAAHQDAGEVDGTPPSAGGPPELSPDVKQQIADEVRNQLALENQEAQQDTQQKDVDPASSGIARMLSDGRPHVFVVGSALDVVDTSQTECALSDGDVLQLQTQPPADATVANLVVLASKGGPECQKQDTVSVQLTDLQEMQNHMRENIDQGLQDLQAKQGTGGIPALPPSAQSQPAPAQYAAVAPPPDPNAGTEIQQQTQQADQAETDATQPTGAPAGATPASAAPAAPAAPASIELGQTPDQVQAAMGAPSRVANLGPKVIYYYSGMKVTFVNGKVSDVQ